MKIVFLVNHFPVGGVSTGGAGNYVANMASIMQRFGHDVTVITEAEKSEVVYWNEIEIRRIRATRGFRDTGRPMRTYKKFLKNIWRSVWYNWEVYKISRKEKIDIVQSSSTYGIPILRIKKVPYVVRVSEYHPLWSGARKLEYDFKTCLKSHHIDEEIIFLGFKRADRIVVPSYLMKDLIYRKVRKESIVVESPVVMDGGDALALQERELTENKYWVTYSAMNYRKEIHILAKIIDDLLDAYPDMKYVMIGRDSEVFYEGNFMKTSDFFDMHIKKNKNRFLFMGEISDRKRLFSIVKNSYACILPTRVDNLPNTCLEAMALGKIVVSSTCVYGTSVEQLITDGDNGFLAQVDDMANLYNKIVCAMQLSPEEKRVMEERAKDRVKGLTPEKIYKEMMKIYSKVLTQ